MYLEHRPEKMREEDFRNPPARFRGTPFWAWNCTLKKENLRKQIGYLKKWEWAVFICTAVQV